MKTAKTAKPKAPPVTFERLRAALERGAADGTGITGAAEELGVSRNAVRKALERWPNAAEGLELPAAGWPAGKPRSAERVAEAVAALEKHGTARKAAESLGISLRGLRMRLAKAKRADEAKAK